MKRIIKVILLLALPALSYAQEAPKLYTLPSPFERYSHFLATVRVTGSVPIGSFSDSYIDKTSFENYSVSMEWINRGPVSVGGEIGYSYYRKQLPRALYANGDETISAVQTRTLTQYPIQIFANYHFLGKNSSVQPYVQVSGGVSVLDYSLYYGMLADQKQKVSPTYGVGLGSKFLFKKDGSFGADVRVKYAGTTFKYDYVTSGVNAFNTSVGIFYRWW
jgi:hypothetical protein